MQHLKDAFSGCAYSHRGDILEPTLHRGDVSIGQGLEVAARLEEGLGCHAVRVCGLSLHPWVEQNTPLP